MSVQTALENLSARIVEAYSYLSSKGAEMPQTKSTYNLPQSINTIEALSGQHVGILHANAIDDATEDDDIFQKSIVPDAGYNGIRSATLQYKTTTKTVSPLTSQQDIVLTNSELSSGIVGMRQVTVNGVTNSIDSNIQAGNIKNGVTILGVTGNLVVPSGTIQITSNGNHDVTQYVTANVNVPGIVPSGNINLTSMSQTNVTNYATAQIVDADLVSGNIKKDVNILGVTGTYEGEGGGGLQGYTVTIYSTGSAGAASGTIYKADGTTQSFYDSGTFTNVIYVEAGDILLGDANSGYQSTLKIAILSNCELWFGYGCILKGTLINLWNGETKPIEEINYEDETLCWNFDNGRFSKAKPFWIKKAQKNTFYWINKFKSGKIIKTTGTVAGHRFFDTEQNKFLYNTECKGHLCYTVDGPDVLLDCEYVEEECEFYNIYTDYHMNLFANGILTGFRYNNLYPIKDMKFIKDNRPLRSREEFKQIPDNWFYGMRCAEQLDSTEEIASYVLSREMIKKV